MEGNLIKIEQQPAADVPVCRARSAVDVMLVHVSPPVGLQRVYCVTHTPGMDLGLRG